jgi:hypothetical protein
MFIGHSHDIKFFFRFFFSFFCSSYMFVLIYLITFLREKIYFSHKMREIGPEAGHILYLRILYPIPHHAEGLVDPVDLALKNRNWF